MDGKDSEPTVHNEKEIISHPDKETAYPSEKDTAFSPTTEHIADASARRSSVAHNVVENPLTRQSKEECAFAAEEWAKKHGMSEHTALFSKAALVARDPERFEMLNVLDDEERRALIYERDHKWHGPKMLWYSIGLCAIGAATQGWDQTGSNGEHEPPQFPLAALATQAIHLVVPLRF